MARLEFKERTAGKLYVYFRHGKFNTKRAIKVSLENHRFDYSKQSVMSGSNKGLINSQLRKFRDLVLDTFEKDTVSGDNSIRINSEWFKAIYNEFWQTNMMFSRKQDIRQEDRRKLYLWDAIDYYLQQQERKSKGSKSAMRNIIRQKPVLKRVDKNVLLVKINKAWLDNYQLNYIDEGFSPSTIEKWLLTILASLRYSDSELIHRSVYNYKIPVIPEDKFVVPILEEEFKLIKEAEGLPKNLENIRNIVIIGMRTGLRLKLLLKLIKWGGVKKDTSITNFTLKKHLLIAQTEKGKNPPIVELYVSDTTIEILRNTKPISDRTLNKNLKKLLKVAGVDSPTKGFKRGHKVLDNGEVLRSGRTFGEFSKHELITVHSLRRSLATFLSENKFHKDEIAKVLAHSSTTVTDRYIAGKPVMRSKRFKRFMKKNEETRW